MRKLSNCAHGIRGFGANAEGMDRQPVNGHTRRRSSRIAHDRSVRRLMVSCLLAVTSGRDSRTQQAVGSSTTISVDPEWAIATSVPIGCGAADTEADIVGVVTARRHATGWFISATRRAGISAEDVEDFAHFVTVRVYLLLHCGPGRGTWTSDGPQDQWHACLRAG
jgi:hypothetical protein